MTTYKLFNLNAAHPSWHICLDEALQQMDPDYLARLTHNPEWLPGSEKIFNAFSLPMEKVNYILFGESPYPRPQSANGYAFWDAAVGDIWSAIGLNKKVNRATSLRNIIKMLLVATNALPPNQTGQDDIAKLDKQPFIQTNTELFNNFLNHGFLLLNATPVLQPNQVRKDAIAWHPFVKYILNHLFDRYPHIQLLLLGNVANTINKLISHPEIKRLYAEHPYNISFITNPDILNFFQPLHLLAKNTYYDI